MTIRPTGGNPGFYLESQTTTGANQGVNHLLINEDIVWTPASDGELLNLTLELDHLGGNQGYQLLVLQDGVFYIAPGWGHATGGHQAWTALATLGPSEDSDFVAVIGAYAVDPDVHPDFSTNGSPLQFGFATANFSSGGVVGSYDNWRVTVSVVPAPPAAALLICGALPFARRRR